MLSETIKNNRKRMGLTQKELADLIGVSRISINYYENSKKIPSQKTMDRLGSILGIENFEELRQKALGTMPTEKKLGEILKRLKRIEKKIDFQDMREFEELNIKSDEVWRKASKLEKRLENIKNAK